MTHSEQMSVTCGMCGDELSHLGALNDGTHTCEESARFGAFLATGDPEVL